MNPVRYRISASNPNAHVYEVACTVVDPDPAGQSFRLPSWVPGSYLIREFARHFIAVRASCAGASVEVVKTSKDVWQVAPCSGQLTLTADVYAFDLSVRAAFLDATRGFFNGPSVFVWPVGQEARTCELEIVAPVGAAFSEWRVATSLPRAGAQPYGFGTYRAGNYDELIDHPVEMGRFDLVHFEAGGAHHDVAVTGRHRGDLSRLARDVQRICQTQIDMYAGAPASRAPIDRYVFQLLVLNEGYGGLEHRASTSLVSKRDALPVPGESVSSDDYRNLLGLFSHEYFHTWNVKRIKPAAFVPYDLTREAYTRQLWAFEGITSYYDDLMLVRSGVIAADDYLQLLGRNVTTVLRAPGRAKQSVADSSFDAWIKHYRQDENSPNAVVSYYAKGALVGLALDLTLRRDSGITLDDVMRELWRRFGATELGVPEGGVEAIAGELSGRDLAPWFERYVHGTAELPLAELLGFVGVNFNLRQATDARDKGGKAAKDTPPEVWFGARIASVSTLRLTHVLNGGPAERAGMAAGDVVVAIDGLRASAEVIERMLRTRTSGDVVVVHAFRRDELLNFRLELGAAPVDTCWLMPDDNATAPALAQRAAWLLSENRRATGAGVGATISSAAAPSSLKTAVLRRGPSRRAKAR
ncbi:MAG: PDZ domain-containing protein [Casimicrobiaceae bacterium]